MEKETSLSEKIKKENTVGDRMISFIYMKDVREAVLRFKKLLKRHDDMFNKTEGRHFNPDCNWALLERFDKIFGDKLTETEGRGL